MAAEESPEARDIYWFNTGITQKERRRRRYVVETFLLLLYVFYVVPVTLLYLLLSADSIQSYAAWIARLYTTVSVVYVCMCVCFVRLFFSKAVTGCVLFVHYNIV